MTWLSSGTSPSTLQSLTRNALADPYLLGVSSGASTGAVGVVLLGFAGSQLGVASGAFCGALVSFGLLLLRRTGLHSTRIVLTGVVVGQLFTALTSLILMSNGDADSTRALTHWLLGSLAPARGTDTAASLGIDVRTTRAVLLVTTSLLTAVAVAVAAVGAIGFVGLIVPHGVRFLVGPTHRLLLPVCAVVGAAFLVWTDALARVAFAPLEVPVGVFIVLLGVPLFLLVLRRRGEL
ncbi:FecCD family ABC transporter permease [Micromonospora sp. WMMD737]|uniref:FecCD family ABC transporter permease n=1 Tax=Micromonospora sp. WMMD737 TaxID=3404113 RepID=UPI003B932BA1